jgi:hypothetical protein
MLDTQCISQDEIAELRKAGTVVNPKERWLNYTIEVSYNGLEATATIPHDAPFPISMLVKGCLYMIPTEFNTRFSENFISGQLNGTLELVYAEEGYPSVSITTVTQTSTG